MFINTVNSNLRELHYLKKLMVFSVIARQKYETRGMRSTVKHRKVKCGACRRVAMGNNLNLSSNKEMNEGFHTTVRIS